MSEQPILLVIASALMLTAGPLASGADGPPDKSETIVREIFVPFESLDALLENQPQRILLSREEYEALIEEAEVAPETAAPQPALVASADYAATVEEGRAIISGTLTVEVLDDGLHALPLDLSGVGLQQATLDGQAAAIGRAENGQLKLFVEGKGRHALLLKMVAPLETTAARQVLNVRLPRPPAAKLSLTVPGDVEITSGADVAARVVDEAAGVTRFEVLPRQGDMTLVMTLNSRLHRLQRAVTARSVIVDEVTEAYERLHATVSIQVLYQAVGRFRFAIPDGFEITDVKSPLLARWEISTDGAGPVLEIRLRDQSDENIVLNVSAIKTGVKLDDWTFPKLELLEIPDELQVVGRVAVLGLLVDERLEAESIDTKGLIPIDTAIVRPAIPETVFQVEPGAPTLRSVVAYYAPHSQFDFQGRFAKPPAEISVMTNVLLLLGEQDRRVRGEFFLSPKAEKLFDVDFSVPPDWRVTSVTTPDGNPLHFERYGPKDQEGRIHVRLAEGVPPGGECQIYFNALSTPADWLGKWDSRQVEFPVFVVADAQDDVGAIAVEAPDGEMEIRIQPGPNLTPLDAAERQQYGLDDSDTSAVLAYRYESSPYQATLEVRRTKPRLTARTYSFLNFRDDTLAADYEVVYQVDDARTRKLSLLLPKNTPADLSIVALDDATVKQSDDTEVEDGAMRRWDVLLEEPRKGTIRLAVSFKQPLAEWDQSAKEQELEDLALPIVRADGVDYQSGLVAVEADAELEVQVDTTARQVDVGELAAARRKPGRGLLGVFGFVGDPPQVQIDVFRRPGYRLHPAIVEKAELRTRLSADGENITVAQFDLRTKAVFLEVELPPGGELWAANLDETPVKPQREGDRLLMSLPTASGDAPRSLRIVYRMPADSLTLAGRVDVPAPRLRLRGEDKAESVEVPVADLVWRLYPPPGYELTRSGGTVVAQVESPRPAILTVAKIVRDIVFCPGPIFLGAQYSSQSSPSPYYMSDDAQYYPPTSAPQAVAPAEEYDMDADFEEFSKVAAGVTLEDMGEAEEETAAEEAYGEQMDAPAESAGGQSYLLFSREAEGLAQEARQDGRPRDGDSLTVVLDESSSMPFDDNGPILYPDAQVWEDLTARRRAGTPRRPEGFRSLMIDLEDDPDGDGQITFHSLGVQPRLAVTLANRPRFEAVAWALAAMVGLVGLALTTRSCRTKFRFVLAVLLLGTLIPMIPGWELTAGPLNWAVYAASCLVPYYLLAGFLRLTCGWLSGLYRRVRSALAITTASAAILATALSIPTSDAAEAQAKLDGLTVQLVRPPDPVKVPDDAVILPYDPKSQTGIHGADRMLVPYAKYVELWNLAHPDEKIQTDPPPARYALAGSSYRARLEGEEYLLVEGELDVDVYVDDFAEVPLALGGGVLARAELDGKPARLSVPVVTPQGANQLAANQAKQQAAVQQPVDPNSSLVLLHVSGKGRHRLDLAVRLRLARRGGWRVAEGVLPSAPAAALSIGVPQPETEVRLGQVVDRRSYETDQADQAIETVLGPGGAISVQWRPKVSEGEVDRSLTAQSYAVLDVEDDGLRLVWELTLQFPRGERDLLEIEVPKQYMVQQVDGTNVRGWEVSQDSERQRIEVSLLKTAKNSESFAVHLWREGPIGPEGLSQFDAPAVTVPEAALHNGRLTIRRSPLLDLRAVAGPSVTQIDLETVSDQAQRTAGSGDERPLSVLPNEAYKFIATPFSLRMNVKAVEQKVTATVQTTLKIAEFERSLESQVNLDVRNRPLHRVEMFLPDDLELDDVSAPGDFKWSVARRDNRPLLIVYLASGQQGSLPVGIAGKLAGQAATEPISLPRIELLDVQQQEGQIAVQVDPAFTVVDSDLQNCEKVSLSRLYGWLNPVHRDATQLSIGYDRPDYSGKLQLSPLKPIVTCETITNVRITDRAVEETVLLNFTIEQAGVRELVFLLPHWMRKSRIRVPMQREKTIQPVDDQPESPLRVRLQLQDEVMGERLVLVEHDRALTDQPYLVPIPVVETGRTERQIIALQSAGRDEVVVDREQLTGLQQLRHLQSDWKDIREALGGVGGITQAYLVVPDGHEPKLVFRTKRREVHHTVGARIGLAETSLVVDANGAYRAEQIYQLYNSTEQFLEVKLPQAARLWTAQRWTARDWEIRQSGNRASGEPLKPTKVPHSNDPRLVRIPLVKTAAGDLDYVLQLQYAGKMPPLDAMRAANSPVDFPLMHTVNVKVQQSQVRLYLPETHRWFDFGGTMNMVSEEADLAAGYVSYQNKQAERLKETMTSAQSSGRLRAADNLKQLMTNFDMFQSRQEPSVSNESLEQEYARNANVLDEAEQQARQIETDAAQPAEYDNRWRLNTVFEGQKTTSPQNVVQDLGSNWERPEDGQPAATNQPADFNSGWFISNGLLNPSEARKLEESKKPASRPEEPQSEMAPFESKSRLITGKTSQPTAQERYRGTRFKQDKAAQKPQPTTSDSKSHRGKPGGQPQGEQEGSGGGMGGMGGFGGGGRGSGQEAADSFGMPGETRGGRVALPALTADASGPVRLGTEVYPVADLVIPLGEDAQGLAGLVDSGGEAAFPVGLASLDVRLPTHGVVHRFSTPGGDVAITARAVSDELVTKAIHAAATLAAALVLLYLVRLAGRGGFDWITGPVVSICLIFVGVIGLLVTPVIALVMLATGITNIARRLGSRTATEPKIQEELITPEVVE